MRHRVNFLVLTAIAAVVIGAGACSSSGAPLTPTPTPIDPEALLLASGRLMKGLEAFHFRLSHESGATALLPNLLVDEVEGDVMKPNRISVRFTGTLGSLAFRADLITVGDASYMTNPLTGQWGPAPGEVSPLGFFSEIDSMMAQVDQVRLVSSDGRVHRLSGRIPAEGFGSAGRGGRERSQCRGGVRDRRRELSSCKGDVRRQSHSCRVRWHGQGYHTLALWRACYNRAAPVVSPGITHIKLPGPK